MVLVVLTNRIVVGLNLPSVEYSSIVRFSYLHKVFEWVIVLASVENKSL